MRYRRDGIFRSFKISSLNFRTKTKEAKGVILITAHEKDSEEVLGFIRFKYDKDDLCVGGLQLVNFRATLPYRSLSLGGSPKVHDSTQTGQHGEGMKLSALIFRRKNYNLRIESGGFRWSFLFKKGELACGLGRMSKKKLDKIKQAEMGKPRTDIAHPWEDVCVIIGAPGFGRNIWNDKVQGKRMHKDQFQDMLRVSLDINPPEKIVHTPHGDLIRDPTYQGKMYLRGLLLPKGGMSGKEYLMATTLLMVLLRATETI